MPSFSSLFEPRMRDITVGPLTLTVDVNCPATLIDDLGTDPVGALETLEGFIESWDVVDDDGEPLPVKLTSLPLPLLTEVVRVYSAEATSFPLATKPSPTVSKTQSPGSIRRRKPPASSG